MTLERNAIPETAEPVDVLAIGAHPDDVELGCGGTFLIFKKMGLRTGVLDLTRGELGSRGTPQLRAQEAQDAARLMGLRFRLNLGLADGELAAGRDSRLALIRLLRICRPRLVITHSATGHPDHWEACKLVREACHHSGLAKIDTGQPRHRPDKTAHWLEFTQNQAPQVVVDISTVYEAKEDLLQCYASQLHNGGSREPETYLSRPEFLDQIRAQCRHYGNLAGCGYGEGFLLSRPPRVQNLLEC